MAASVRKGQVAGEYQPGSAGMRGQGRADPDDGAAALDGIDDQRTMCASGFGYLGGAHRHEDFGDTCRRTQFEGAVELALALIGERGLVALHARAGAAGEYQSVDGVAANVNSRGLFEHVGALAAVLGDQSGVGDHDVVRQRLAHVVNGQRRDAGAGEGLHFDAGLVVHAHRAANHGRVAFEVDDHAAALEAQG
jgi:hypothetical protein